MAKNKEDNMNTTKSYYGAIEYEMPKEMAKQILATRKGEERNMHPQEFLKKIVNTEFGILGNCVKVTTF